MTINITIGGIFLVLLMILVVTTIFSVFMLFYYKRLAMQMDWRIDVAKAISKQMKKMKEKHKFTEEQKYFLNSMLDSSHSNKFVRQFLQTISQAKKRAKHDGVKDLLQMSEDLGIKEGLEKKGDGGLLADAVFLRLLCMLHASTHSFFLGFKLRNEMENFIDLFTGTKETEEAIVKKPARKYIDTVKIYHTETNLSGGEILSFIDNKFFGGRQTA